MNQESSPAIRYDEPPRELPQSRSDLPIKLVTNGFRLLMNPGAIIYAYLFTITPAPASGKELRELLEKSFWEKLKKLFPSGRIFVRFPGTAGQKGCHGHVFAASEVLRELKISEKINEKKVDLVLEKDTEFSAEQFNKGFVGEIDVLASHVAKKLLGGLRYRKCGKKYYNTEDVVLDDKADGTKITTFAGVHTFLCCTNAAGPQLQINTLFPSIAKTKENVFKVVSACLDDPTHHAIDYNDSNKGGPVRETWRRCCLYKTVLTEYNIRPYRIKAIHWDKNPKDTTFQYRDRERKVLHTLAYEEFYQKFYSREVKEQKQPLLEAYPEKQSETVFLIPEFCLLVGPTDDMKRDKQQMAETLKQSKVSPSERLDAIVEVAKKAAKSDEKEAVHAGEDWKMKLDDEPTEVGARNVGANLEVNFGSKKFPIEEGNFQRWMRHGLQCPVKLDDWLFIAGSDEKHVLEIWLTSLTDIAQVAFGMTMAKPRRLECSNQIGEIAGLVKAHLKPSTQMVLLLTPSKDSRAVYTAFKDATCGETPCITQVVKSETIRKRQSIAAVLSRIVLQMNAKFCGPLWQIELKCPVTAPLFEKATMVIGLYPYNSYAETDHPAPQCLGFAASLDTHCTEYHSNARKLAVKDTAQDVSVTIQQFFRNALIEFHKRNELLPEHIIVYRAGYKQEDEQIVRETEIGAFRKIIEVVKEMSGTYAPDLTYITIAKSPTLRLFDRSSKKNPDPGTVVDDPQICSNTRSSYSFWLINQYVTGKGTAVPTLYTVLEDDSKDPKRREALQHLTHRLSFLYYNYVGSVKMPAPAQYAKKIAHFVATALTKEPSPRLLNTFFYL